MTTDTKTKERPILFSGEMVRAILDGRKTQTRRVIKPQPCGEVAWMRESGDRMTFVQDWDGESGKPFACPYGQPGDELWVRESTHKSENVLDAGVYTADQGEKGSKLIRDESGIASWWYSRASCPSIHMPRWASRIQLRVTDVRVERVQDISGKDAAAEGCSPDWEEFNARTCAEEGWEEPDEFIEECEQECDWINYGHDLVYSREHGEWERDRTNYALRIAFETLWDSINESRGFGWDTNPWVWVVEFEKLEPTL